MQILLSLKISLKKPFLSHPDISADLAVINFLPGMT